MKYLASLVVCLSLAACSKKSDQPAPGAAPAAPANSAGCPSCAKFTACCKAIVAKGLDDSEAKHCDQRETACSSAGAAIQGDFDKTCADRLAKRKTDHPDIPECQ